MVKKTIPWKKNKIISIETRKNIFVLAQMLESPFLRFYNVFRSDEDWENIDTSILETLFVNAVTTRGFLKNSNISVVKNAIPDLKRIDSKTWIKGKSGNRKITIWEGTKYEREFYTMGNEPGGDLVEMDFSKKGGYDDPCGLYDKMIMEDIPLNADNIIDNNELTGLAVFPLMNERLYQCYKANRNVDPAKDIRFNRDLPIHYNIAVEIMSGGGNKENKEKLLDKYFR